MATAKFLHVGLNFEGKPPAQKVLTNVFDKALDWVRYAPNCYILYTTTEAREWAERLRNVLPQSNSIFIVEFDIRSRTGYLQKMVWDWLSKNRA